MSKITIDRAVVERAMEAEYQAAMQAAQAAIQAVEGAA